MPLPVGAKLVLDCGVVTDDVPIGLALIQFTNTGIYALIGGGIVRSVSQSEVAEFLKAIALENDNG